MNWKIPVLGAAMVLVFVLALWLARAVDSGRFGPTRADRAKRTLTVTVDPVTRQDYLVMCNEEHYQEAFGEFRRFVDIGADALSVPGGPMLVALADVDLPEEFRPHQRVLIEVLKRHAPQRVVLMAHEDCLIYDSIGAWFGDPGSVRYRQYLHLQQARLVIQTWFPQTTVEIFYGEKVGDRQMRFFPVPNDSLIGSINLTPSNGEFEPKR